MSSPISFLTALKDRYGSEDTTDYTSAAFDVGDTTNAANTGTCKKNNKKWEFVGMEKTRSQQAQHSRLRTIVLQDSGIAHAEDESQRGEIAAASLNRVTELDLSGNTALTAPDQISIILQGLPSASLVQLNRIPLSHSSADTDSADPAASLSSITWPPRLKQLVLNGCSLGSLTPLSGLSLPQCEEIHLDYNGISELFDGSSRDFSGFPNVTTLSIAQNNFDSWTDGRSGLHRLVTDVFPRLTSLSLGGNKGKLADLPLDELKAHLTASQSEEGKEKGATATADIIASLARLLGQLTTLDISDFSSPPSSSSSETDKEDKSAATPVPITSSITLEALRRVASPSLTALRVSYANLYPDKSQVPTEATARQLTIAALPHLTTLNRAAVRPKERFNSELYYLQRALAAFATAHPEAVTAADAEAAEAEKAAAAQQQQQQDNNSNNNSNDTTNSASSNNNIPTPMSLLGKGAEQDPDTLRQYPVLPDLLVTHKDVILTPVSQAGGSSGGGARATAAGGGISSGAGLLIDITLRATEGGAADAKKRVPSSLTVARAKSLAASVYSNIEVAHMALQFLSAGEIAAPTPLDNDSQTLGFYGVGSGALVLVKNTRAADK